MRWMAVLVLAASLAGFWLRPRALAPLPPEATFTVSIGPAVLTVQARGNLTSSSQQAINVAGMSGQIEEIVEEGSHVKKGQVVGRISTFQWEEQERTARQDVYKKQAEMKRTQRENQQSAAEDARKTAEKKEELTFNRRVLAFLEQGPDPRTVESLSLKIEKEKLEGATLARRIAVQEQLKEKGFASELDFETLKSEQAKSRLERAKQENLLADKREGPRPEERERSRRQVDRYVIDHELAASSQASQEVLRKLSLSKKDAELKDRQAAVDQKARLRERAVFKAPISGTVIYGDRAARGEAIGIGAGVYNGLTLMKIVKRGTMHAELDVPERWLDRVREGQRTVVYAAHRTQGHAAKVLSVAKLASATDGDTSGARAFRVVVRLDVDDDQLKPDMSCVADIEIARHDKLARLPVDLVRARNHQTITLAARRGREKVELTAQVVDEDRDFVYVTGLSAGEVLLY